MNAAMLLSNHRTVGAGQLQFAKDAVDYPVYRSGTHAVALANGFVLQMFHNEFDKGQLHAGRIGYDKFLTAIFVLQHNGLVCEDGK